MQNIWNLRNIRLLQNRRDVEAPHPPPGYSSLSNAQFNNLSVIRDERPETSDRERQRVRDDVYLVAEQKELGGRNRYVADGFLNSTECEFLMQLATVRNCNPVVRLDWTAVIRMFFQTDVDDCSGRRWLQRIQKSTFEVREIRGNHRR